MIEFALCIPILAGVLMLSFILGWGLLNQQQLRSNARYSTWTYANVEHPGDIRSTRTSDELRNFGFAFAPANLWQDAATPADSSWSVDDLIRRANVVSPAAGQMADQTIHQQLPVGYGDKVTGDFQSPLPFFKYTGISGQQFSAHARSIGDWAYHDTLPGSNRVPGEAVIGQFLPQMEAAFQSVNGAGGGLANNLRDLYRSGW